MNTNTYIKVKTQFEALHYWPDAPEAVSFLRHPHRHVFHVEVMFEVSHADRQLEFFLVQRDVKRVCRDLERPDPWTWSCEDFADHIFHKLRPTYPTIRGISVSEDGENGALITCEG